MLARSMHRNPHTNAPLTKVLEELQAAAARPFGDARPIPAAVNHSLEFLDLERRAVFEHEWICVGREDEIPAPGDFLTHDIAGVPVLVVRQQDGEIRAFVNACAHRFACLVPDASGSRKRFTCRYHAWTYDCAGELLRAPYMEMQDGFDRSQHRLRPLQASGWEGFIYVTLAQDPVKHLPEALAPLRDQVVGRYDMACYRTIMRETMEWDANWKNLVENFTESYHVPIAHGKTFAQHNKPLQDYICGEDRADYCYHRAPQAAASGRGAAHPRNERLDGEWRRMMVDFCVFPNHLVTLMPDYLWYISVQPLGTDKMRATWGLAVPPEVLADVAEETYDSWLADFRNYMEVANGEDRELVEALHRGSASALLPTGTYHPIERNLWQFTNYLARVCRA
ncbi:MAG: Rieske 2Fe-2S domain-containing protein [Gammaproteobacteria bacterium]|nr:Rieske 2Fe-2S domain-containing protein [Gammaproteobacteria bacterium]